MNLTRDAYVTFLNNRASGPECVDQVYVANAEHDLNMKDSKNELQMLFDNARRIGDVDTRTVSKLFRKAKGAGTSDPLLKIALTKKHLQDKVEGFKQLAGKQVEGVKQLASYPFKGRKIHSKKVLEKTAAGQLLRANQELPFFQTVPSEYLEVSFEGFTKELEKIALGVPGKNLAFRPQKIFHIADELGGAGRAGRAARSTVKPAAASYGSKPIAERLAESRAAPKPGFLSRMFGGG